MINISSSHPITLLMKEKHEGTFMIYKSVEFSCRTLCGILQLPAASVWIRLHHVYSLKPGSSHQTDTIWCGRTALGLCSALHASPQYLTPPPKNYIFVLYFFLTRFCRMLLALRVHTSCSSAVSDSFQLHSVAPHASHWCPRGSGSVAQHIRWALTLPLCCGWAAASPTWGLSKLVTCLYESDILKIHLII